MLEDMLLKELRKVRDAGAQDDNNGGEDWTQSDQTVEASVAAILKRHKEELVAAKRKGALISIRQYIQACNDNKELPSWDNLNAFHAGQLKAYKQLQASNNTEIAE